MKLRICFGNENLIFTSDEKWCRKSYAKVIKAMKVQRNIFTFESRTGLEDVCIKVSEIKFVRLDEEE